MGFGAALFFSSCASDVMMFPVPHQPRVLSQTADGGARVFNYALVDAIERADQIVVREHSHPGDFSGVSLGRGNTPVYIYASKDLSPGERVLFSEGVRGMSNQSSVADRGCSFVSHHTIDFYERGSLSSRMKVSYKCSEVQWNGSSGKPSKDVFKVITPLIKRAGMIPHRDWKQVAEQQFEADGVHSPLDKKPVLGGGVPTAEWAPGEVGKKVLNPFTKQLVDVEGIPAGTKVRDPNDKDQSHIFKIPSL